MEKEINYLTEKIHQHEVVNARLEIRLKSLQRSFNALTISTILLGLAVLIHITLA